MGKAWIGVGMWLCAAGPSLAGPITLEGVTFDDRLGGVLLHSGSGTGSLDDPFVLVEDILEEGPAILSITGLGYAFGNRVGTRHTVGFALTKIVRNLTRHDWEVFELEARELLSRTSPYEDGLSFAQDAEDRRLIASDRYDNAHKTDEPLELGRLLRRLGPPRRDRDGAGGHHRLLADLRVLSAAAAQRAGGVVGAGRGEVGGTRPHPESMLACLNTRFEDGGGTAMAKYILLMSWTGDGVRAVKDSPGRLDKARELAKSVGAKIEQFYMVMGDHDMVAVLDAPQRRRGRHLRAEAVDGRLGADQDAEGVHRGPVSRDPGRALSRSRLSGSLRGPA